jgi:single-stranded DNA-binding protein
MKPEVNMVGRLTRNVSNIFKNTDGSAERALFTIACNSYYKGTDGAKKESVDFIPCICWGGLVPVMTTWGLKGRLVHIRGSLETFQAGPDENGKYPPTRIQVKVDQLQFLDKKPENVQAPAAQTPETGTPNIPLAGLDLSKLSEMVAAQLLGPANAAANAGNPVPGAQTPEQTQNDINEANAQAAAEAQAATGGDLGSVI